MKVKFNELSLEQKKELVKGRLRDIEIYLMDCLDDQMGEDLETVATFIQSGIETYLDLTEGTEEEP